MTAPPPSAPPPSAHPPRPRAALAIGITGHRPNKLPAEALPAVAARLEALLRALAAAVAAVHRRHAAVFAPEPPRLSLLSALADGADRIAAEAALAAGCRLDAVLPFPREVYAADFTGAESVAAFHRLLGRAEAAMELPGRREEEAAAYEQAGLVMLDHCALLIAVWDGEAAAGRGGTAEIVEAAVRRGLPILWIDPAGHRLPELRWRGMEAHPLPAARFQDLPAQDLVAQDFAAGDPAAGLEALVEELLAPPASSSAEAAGLRAYLAETRRRRHWRPEWHLLAMLAFLRRPGLGDLRSPSPEEAAGGLPGPPDGRTKAVTAAYGWADALGVHYAQIFRSAIVANFLFASLSVGTVALSILIQKSLHWADGRKWVFVLIELVLISLVIVNTMLGKRWGWHCRWLEARELAERLRVALPMIGLGCRPPASRGRAGIWTAWYERALLRAVGLPGRVFSADAVAAARQGLRAMLDDQIRYHESVRHRMERMGHRLERAGEALFVATLLVALFYLLSVLVGLHLSDELSYAVTALTVGFPVLATALYGIRVIADFDGNARRSGRMAGQLETLAAAMAADDPADLRAAQERARQAADIMLGDVANWRLTAEGRGLETPG